MAGSGDLTRTYGAPFEEVVEAATEAVESVGLAPSTNSTTGGTVLIVASRTAVGGGHDVQSIAVEVYVRPTDPETMVDVHLPAERGSYAASSDNEQRRIARRIVSVLDKKLSASR